MVSSLTLPQPPPPETSQRKKAVNHEATKITDPAVLQELKDKQLAAAEAKKEKEEKKLEREREANERKLLKIVKVMDSVQIVECVLVMSRMKRQLKITVYEHKQFNMFQIL